MQIQLYKLKYGHNYNKWNSRLLRVKPNKKQL